MAVMYINQTIPVPNVQEQNTDYIDIEDGDYTALGTYRATKINRKRLWRIRAVYLDADEYTAIKSYLDSIIGGRTDFWIDEFGGSAETNSITTVIKITSDERVQFRKNNMLTNGRNIELEVREV